MLRIIGIYTVTEDNAHTMIGQYLLIIIPVNHLECWNNTRKACKSLTFGS